jgi:hypothetical protein
MTSISGSNTAVISDEDHGFSVPLLRETMTPPKRKSENRGKVIPLTPATGDD